MRFMRLSLNYDKWLNNTNNVLFVTGHSGSGKSTYAKLRCCTVVELDLLDRHDDLPDDFDQEGLDLIIEWLNIGNNRANYNSARHHAKTAVPMQPQHIYREFTKFFLWLCERTELQKDKKFIIEGIQFAFQDPSFFKDRCVVMLDPPRLRCMYNSYIKRDKPNIKELLGLLPDIAKIFRWYAQMEKDICEFRKYLKKKGNR